MAYIRAVQNGNYSAPSTWNGGVVPTTGDIACADTFRITIDTTSILATLSVAMADLVAAGGVAATNKTGGFILPDNSTTSIPEGIRFDHYMTVGRGSISTTVPLHVRPGCTISLGPIVYVSGYAVSGATQLWVVRLDIETSTINATFADFTIPAVESSGGWVIVLNTTVNGGTFNGTFGNCKYVNPGRYLNMMKFFSITSPMSIAYNITINGVIDGYSGDGISFDMYPLSTGLPNQNFTYNGATIGENSGSASSCKTLRIDNVHNVTFTSPLVIGGGFDSSDYEIHITGLRGTVLFQGEVTARYYSLYVAGSGDVTFDQAIYFNKNSMGFYILNTGVIRTKSIIGYGNTTTRMDNDGGLFVDGNSEVIINGDLKYNSGTTMCSPLVSLMGTSTKPVTITGNLDGRNGYISGSTDSSSCLWISNNRTGPITITGNVYGSESGSISTVNLSSGAIRYSTATATYGNLTINGNVYGGTLSPAIPVPIGTNVVVNVVGEVCGGGLYGTNTYGPPGIVMYNGYVSVKALVHHSSGTTPIWGRVKFMDTLQAYVKGRDTSLLEFLLSTQINAIPAASDVRSGVSTGVTTGTLVVPQASTVLDGVVYDNGTTGTLDVFNGPNYVTETRTASQNGYWTDTATWGGESIPTVNSFVYTNGKQVIVDGTVNCAGLADTTETGGLILDADGNAALLDAYGDSTFSDTYVIAEFDGNLLNVASNSGTVPVTMSGGITYSTSHPQFGKTNSRIGANSGALFTLPTTSGKELTVEWWWYPTSLTSAYCGVIPTWGNIEFYNGGVYLRAGGSRLTVNATSDGLTLNTWHHIAITRASSGVTKVYIDGVLRNTQAYTPAIAAGQWRWFTESSGAYLAGYTGGLRVTIGSTLRYDGSFTTPVSVFQTYAPAPGSTLSGRVLLGKNGAVVQSGNNPLNVKTGILQTLISKISSMEDINASNISNILSTTDQFTFTVDGVVADAGTTGGTDYTSRFDTIDGEVLAVKAQTDKLNFTPNAVSVDSILDPYFSDVILLMDNEGDNDSTVFTDLTATATLTNAGTPKLSTSFKKFGVSSAYFDGVSRVDASVINMSSFSHWTIDMWVYMPATVAGSQTLIGSWNGTSTLSLHIGLSSTGVPFIQVSKTGVYEVANSVLAASAITLAEWHMITMTKNGSIYKLYVDGVAVITLNGPASIYNSGAGINIGARDDLSQPFTGYIDSIRITKNVVRQVLDFIVPITDFPGTTSVSPELSYYVSTNATGGGGGDCDLTPVTSSLATLSNDVGTVSSNVNLIKSKTDQLAFTSGNVNSHPDNTSDTTAIKAKTDQLNFISGEVVSTVDLTDIESDLLAVKTKTDQLSFSAGKVIADASMADYTSQLSAITSTVNAINDAVNLIDTVTSKIAFETVYSEGDPNLAQVIFKAEFNGTNGSTVINADTGQTGTNQGSPSLSTAYARTGTSSVALSDSMVSYGNISSLNFGANDFTIEFSVNFSSIPSSAGDYAGVVGKRASYGDFSWICYVTEGKMNFLTSGTNAISTGHPTVLSTGAWYDVAISRTGGILKFYINGVLSQVSCTGLNIATTTGPFFIGRLAYDTSSYPMFGYLDRLRITVGTGRYNSVAPVSPPVSEYPTINSIAQSYRVVANCNSGTTIPADLTDRLTDIRNRINAIHFIVKDE